MYPDFSEENIFIEPEKVRKTWQYQPLLEQERIFLYDRMVSIGGKLFFFFFFFSFFYKFH